MRSTPSYFPMVNLSARTPHVVDSLPVLVFIPEYQAMMGQDNGGIVPSRSANKVIKADEDEVIL